MNKIRIFIIALPFLFISCASGNIYSELFNNLKTLISGPENISLDIINSIPYASMQVRLGKGNNTLLVLEEDRYGILKWTSSNLVKIYTKNGYIVKAKGLENELDNIELDKDHPFNNKNFDIRKIIFTSFYTFNNPKLFRLPVKTKINLIKEEEILIFGNFYKVKLYEEIALENLINWKFRNLYWIDDNGNVLKSIQNFTPKNPEIQMTIAKKYKKPD